jgi:hypothetical protein
MTRFDAAALVWAVLLCLAFAGAIPGLAAVLCFPTILALAVFTLGFLKGVSLEFVAQLRNRR